MNVIDGAGGAAKPMRGLDRERAAAFGTTLHAWFDRGLEEAGRDNGDPRAFTASLLHADHAGYAVTTLLSLGEIVAPSPTRLRMAIWPGARAGRHLASGAPVTLTFVFEQAFHQWRMASPRSLRANAPSDDAASPRSGKDLRLDAFELDVVEGEWVSVDYARLRHGIEFDLEDAAMVGHSDTTLARWLAQRHWLRGLSSENENGAA